MNATFLSRVRLLVLTSLSIVGVVACATTSEADADTPAAGEDPKPEASEAAAAPVPDGFKAIEIRMRHDIPSRGPNAKFTAHVPAELEDQGTDARSMHNLKVWADDQAKFFTVMLIPASGTLDEQKKLLADPNAMPGGIQDPQEIDRTEKRITLKATGGPAAPEASFHMALENIDTEWGSLHCHTGWVPSQAFERALQTCASLRLTSVDSPPPMTELQVPSLGAKIQNVEGAEVEVDEEMEGYATVGHTTLGCSVTLQVPSEFSSNFDDAKSALEGAKVLTAEQDGDAFTVHVRSEKTEHESYETGIEHSIHIRKKVGDRLLDCKASASTDYEAQCPIKACQSLAPLN